MTGKTGLAAAVQRHQPLWQPEASPAATRSEFRIAGVGGRAKNVASIFHLEGIGGKRCLGRTDRDCNEWKECNVTGNYHSILAWEFNVISTEQTLRKNLPLEQWAVFFSFRRPRGQGLREQENTRTLHLRARGIPSGIVDRPGFVLQFRPDGSPRCVQPSLQIVQAKEGFGLNEASKWKIWQSCTSRIQHKDRTPRGRLANGCRRRVQGRP